MNALIEYLRSENSLEQLRAEYGIKAKAHCRYPNLIGFSYEPSVSSMDYQLCRESRGIVLDRDKDWSPVCRPFEKFFNIREKHAANIDWDSAWVEPKLDGSMVCLWSYGNEWQVSTTGTPDGATPGGVNNSTFRDRFFAYLDRRRVHLPLFDRSASGITFIFEFMDHEDPIVIQYPETKAVLLGMRENHTGAWLPVATRRPHWLLHVDVVDRIQLDSINAKQIVELVSKLNGAEYEGFVVVDKHYQRVKVKSPEYVLLRATRFGFSKVLLVELILTGGADDVVSTFPILADRVHKMKSDLQSLARSIDSAFGECYTACSQSRKEFARKVVDNYKEISGVLFALLDNKGTCAIDVIKQMEPRKVLRLMYGA